MKKHWPLWCATAIYVLVTAAQLAVILHKTHGRQFYPLDDTYIHAAVAKNIAFHGVYGLTRYHPSFPCSSILWPFILAAGFKLAGLHTWMPMAINAVFSLAVLALASGLLLRVRPTLSPGLRALCLLLLVLGVPLVGMTFLGMEHVLHLLAFLLLLGSYEAVSRSSPTRAAVITFLVASFLITGARYEGAFAILLVCCALALAGRWALAFASAAAAALPIVAFGIYGLRHGSTFLPSPLLVKTANVHKFSPLTGLHNLFSGHALYAGVTLTFLLCAAMLVYLRTRVSPSHRAAQGWLVIVLGVFLLHAQLAQFGGFFRYEAYLVGVGIVALFRGIASLLDPALPTGLRKEARTVAMALVTVAILTAGVRGAAMLYIMPGQAYSVYEQQYQVAQFLNQYYTGQGVALNDIGAPNYFGDIDCLDLWGLGSYEVQRLRARNALDRGAIDRLSLTHHVKVAVIYRDWFKNRIPAEWVPVYDWTITDIHGHNVLGGNTVTLYAVDPAEVPELARDAEAFRSQLPAGVATFKLPDAAHPDSVPQPGS